MKDTDKVKAQVMQLVACRDGVGVAKDKLRVAQHHCSEVEKELIRVMGACGKKRATRGFVVGKTSYSLVFEGGKSALREDLFDMEVL